MKRTRDVAAEAQAQVAWLKRKSSAKVRAGMARYGLPSENAVGVSVGAIQARAKELGRDHALALALWETGIYEARLMASMLGEPEKLTAAKMEAWCRDFDNWGVVDTVCFKFFDQSPLAWKKVGPWSKRTGEFQKRAGVVLIACLAAHVEDATDEDFLRVLPVIEEAAEDERNFVKKGVSWALRMVGRRSVTLNVAAVELARRLMEAESAGAKWVGRDALRELTSAAVLKRVKEKAAKAEGKEGTKGKEKRKGNGMKG